MLGGVSKFTIYAWMSRGLLERTRVGGCVMVRKSSLLKLLEHGKQQEWPRGEEKGIPMPASELETAVRVPRLVTLLEVADMLRLSPHTIRKMVRQNGLRPIKICRRLLFNAEDIANFLAGAK